MAGYTPNNAAGQVVARGLMQSQQSPEAAIKWLERNYKKRLTELSAQHRRAQSRRTIRLELARVIAEEQKRRADLEERSGSISAQGPGIGSS